VNKDILEKFDLINYPLTKNYKRDEVFNDLVKDKTIAYVGPAPNLQGLGMGEFIDSHDLVFRVGDSPVGFMGATGKENDYGSRTDVLVHSFNDHDRPQLEKDINWLRSLKYFLEPMVQSHEAQRQAQWFGRIGVPIHHVPDEHVKPGPLFDYLGSLPNTGYLGLLTMMYYDIKHLYLTGFTFYNMNEWSDAGNCYFDEWYDTEKYKKHGLNEAKIAKGAYKQIHNPANDIAHFRNILKVEKHRNKIKLDEYLTKHFEE